VFGQDPPVRSQTTQTTSPSTPVQPPSQPPPSYSQPPYAQPSFTNPTPSFQQPSSYPSSSYPSPSYPPPANQPFEDPAIVAKRNAANNVNAKIQERLHQFNVTTTKEVDEFIARSGEIEARSAALAMEKARLDEDRARMDSDIETLTRNFDELSKWLSDNDSTTAAIDIDAVTEPKDPLSKQLLYLVAEEASVEDTLYYLEKKVISGTLDTDTFLKSVRALSTEQFVKRATIKKIHEKQRGGR